MSSQPRISLIDQELLRTLEAAFARHAGSDQLVDAADLQRALGLTSEYLARRVLKVFDRDGSGSVDRTEFLKGVRELVFGSERDKLRFAFSLHDDDDDGTISEQEMLRMISISLAESDVISRRSQPPERLARAMLEFADQDGDGRISFAEFEAAMRRYPDLLVAMTRSEALWIAPNEALLQRLDGRNAVRPGKLGRLLENHWLDLLLVALWAVANLGLFALGSRALGSRPATDHWVRLGRGLASCLDFNGALLFVPVLRGLLGRVRRTWLGRKLSIDEAVDVHRLLGQVVFALALAHSIAFAFAYQRGHGGLAAAHVLASYRGGTGAALMLVFAVIWLFAQAPIRRSQRFELFYFTHLLYVVWVVLLVVHAPAFLAWAGLPLGALAAEQLGRRWRRRGATTVVTAAALRSGVTRLELKRPAGFQFDAGDYVFLNVPQVARHEWHPFTLSSAPERDALTVHVRTLGNWTAALRERVEARELSGEQQELSVRIDGPYGSPSARIFAAKHAVLIGAGIGVTPFASVLESIALRGKGQSGAVSALEHVHFFWLNRDQYSFEWFAAMLAQVEQTDHQQLLDLHICMTGGRAGSTAAGLEIAREVLHEQGRRDLVTGLRAKTHMGHPDWALALAAIAEQHAPDVVDVFFCGPLGLATKLRAVCARTQMRFHEEKF
jgi:NADPH oxidase 5